jgi:hypothetical protein
MKTSAVSRNSYCDLEALLHPSGAFGRPIDVVKAADLTLNEKRAILASWASDACAVEAAPALRRAPGGDGTVAIDEILDSLRSLDVQANEERALTDRYRRLGRRRFLEMRRFARNAASPRAGDRRDPCGRRPAPQAF